MNSTKERIIQASATLFAQKGCKSVTMDDIADAMGISKRTIYENFSDKKDLLVHSMEYFFQHRKDVIENILRSSQNIIEAMFESTQRHSELMRQVKFDFINEIRKYFPEIYSSIIQKFKKDHFETGVKMLKKGQEDGVFRKDIDPKLMAILILEINNMMMFQDIFTVYNYNKPVLISTFMATMLRGMATEKGVKILDQYLPMFIENTKKLS
jgi:AcrR family transcriptional regulator